MEPAEKTHSVYTHKYDINEEDQLRDVLRKTREGKHETQATAAKAVGVNRNSWIFWEMGRAPTPDRWPVLAAWTGMPLSELVKFATKPTKTVAPKWFDLAIGHITAAGEAGISLGDIRSSLSALDNRALKQLLSAAERKGFIERRGRGSELRYYRTEKKLTT